MPVLALSTSLQQRQAGRVTTPSPYRYLADEARDASRPITSRMPDP
jgi:hypothetical protein